MVELLLFKWNYLTISSLSIGILHFKCKSLISSVVQLGMHWSLKISTEGEQSFKKYKPQQTFRQHRSK